MIQEIEERSKSKEKENCEKLRDLFKGKVQEEIVIEVDKEDALVLETTLGEVKEKVETPKLQEKFRDRVKNETERERERGKCQTNAKSEETRMQKL